MAPEERDKVPEDRDRVPEDRDKVPEDRDKVPENRGGVHSNKLNLEELPLGAVIVVSTIEGFNRISDKI